MHETIERDLGKNLEMLKEILHYPESSDLIFREFESGDVSMCLIYMEGMAEARIIGELVLRAASAARETTPNADEIRRRVVNVAQADLEKRMDTLAAGVIGGMTALLIDGSEEALLLETRGFPMRGVEQPVNESVVMGSHEGFTENLRNNIALVRRYIQTPDLIVERMTVGTKYPLNIAILHIRGMTSPEALEIVRKRLLTVTAERVNGLGGLMQLIEDAPLSLVPQMLETERPDRAAAGLAEGQFVILGDSSPMALAAPATVFHLLHASDDNFMRWQYGTLLRLIRMAGALTSLLLPGLYVALTLHHTHLLPMSLITSIAEARASVPFTVLTEILIMEFSFYLINEAGTRIPSKFGSALGIVGALILGQAAVDASIISPILIIIIALTGLGSYAIPNYGFSLGVVLYRMALVLASAALGLTGLFLVLFAICAHIAGLTSFGAAFLSPIAPYRPHNPDILLRLPTKLQTKPMFYADKRSRGKT